ncbi:hypothetical protein GGX14DRAFT_659239 [Mycena pura]|uniref:Uncharacterized protein n=1 Tax=Mycena pura TaxID=153505 RepID=A0AAD6V2Z8_9AGAR|nr:hypothetical protein GGX14DRAFT_659239 [Mycena pura]
MSSLANLPILAIASAPALASYTDRPTEREVDRSAFVAISPDREALFASDKSIEEIRQLLKLRAGPTVSHSNWLYQAKQRANVESRDATARTSMLIHRVKNDENDSGNHATVAANTTTDAVRRVLSVASLNRATTARIDNGIPTARHEASGVTVWGSFALSTPNKLISPRPLGPTHMLILHEEPLSVSSKSGKNIFPRGGRKFANLEIAVNDLLLCLNGPKVVARSLPHRLHKELPRVLLHVPNLQTIHKVIVFLHTLNQAELFRGLVPEWMRDAMHPLPLPPPAPSPCPAPVLIADTASIASSKKPRSLFSFRSLRSGAGVGSSTSSLHSADIDASAPAPAAPIPVPAAAAWGTAQDSRAREIVAGLPFFADEDPAKDELVDTLAALHALRANLAFLGFGRRAVWDELEARLGILTRALVLRAAVTDADPGEEAAL